MLVDSKPESCHEDRAPSFLPGPLCPESGGGCRFTVWAPRVSSLHVALMDSGRRVQLQQCGRGYYSGTVQDVSPGTRYRFILNDQQERADPASRFQPEGVFGPSEIVNPSAFRWTDHQWRGIPLHDYLFYELHVGTYSSSGTFEGILDHLEKLKALGITAIELMPIAQFSGDRNWGYDGVFPFAAQNTYGGPHGLQHLVDACHRSGLAVVLDVVYNHLGPEGNFLSDFGPYFTNRYQTPWGEAINFDGPASDEVVRYFVENALYWLRDLHIDALRLDAIHGIFDRNAQPFLALLSAAVEDLARKTKRHIHLIAESDLNDPGFVRPRSEGGYGLTAQWNDDFHHSLHALQTGERMGYYADFGSIHHLQKALSNGYVYTGQYSEFRKRRHGASSTGIAPSQLVVFSQNHDQVGNRMLGERSTALMTFDALKLSAGTVLLSPNIPLLFMGEEYGETAPFLYFTSHADRKLAMAVREGRREEFSSFHSDGTPPDPQATSTFIRSKLDHTLPERGHHRTLLTLYEELIQLRKAVHGFCHPNPTCFEVSDCTDSKALRLQRAVQNSEVLVLFNYGGEELDCSSEIPLGLWCKCIDSADRKWMGPGSKIPNEISHSGFAPLMLAPKSFCAFQRIDTKPTPFLQEATQP
jgi:maltooligosyltrehalose trehalohydrolase